MFEQRFYLIQASLSDIDITQQEALEPITHMTSSAAAAATSTTTTLLLSPHYQLRRVRGHSCGFAFQLKGGGAAPFIQSEQAAEDTPLLPPPLLSSPPHTHTTLCHCHHPVCFWSPACQQDAVFVLVFQSHPLSAL